MAKSKRDPEMLGISKSNLRKYKEWVRMARKKRETQLVPRANRIHKLWRGRYADQWDDDDNETVHVPLVFANIEITKTNVFYKNPKAFVKPKQELFILENGQKLDGRKAAQNLEDAANYVAYDIKLNRTIKKVRDDALTKIYGVIMVGYEGLVGIDEEENEFIRDESIYAVRLDPCSEFLAEPEALDSFAFSDCRWVAREYSIRLSDLLDNPYYENTEELEHGSFHGYDDNVKGEKGEKKTLLDYASSEFRDSKDAQRVTLIEMWKRPTQAEKARGKSGKIIVFSMEGDKPHKVRPWPYDLKGYPFRGLGFNRDNDEFYPFHDVEIYERLLKEKDKMRTAQLEAIKTLGQRKVAISPDYFDSEEDVAKLTDPSSGPIIKVTGVDDIRKAVMALTFGSYPNEMFMVDKKVDEDIDKVSGIGDLRRGLPPPGLDTATEGKMMWAGGGTRFEEKHLEMGEFYESVMRMIVQLIKQTWNPEKMVRRLGTLTPEWPDKFSKEDVQIEDDVEVDIGEMVPQDEVVKKRFALELLELAVKGVTEPTVKQALAIEGYKVSIAEAVKETIAALNVKNQNLLQRVTPQDYINTLKQLMLEAQQKMQGGMGAQPGNTGARTVARKRGIPTVASEIGAEKRRGPHGAPATIFPGGGS